MKFLKKALLGLLAIAAVAGLGTLGPVQRAIAQGMVNFTPLTGVEQISLNYPCTVSCYVTVKQIADYAASQTGGVNNQTGTTYAVVAADSGKLITFNNASAVAVTLPAASSFPTNTAFEFADIGAGAATITPTTSTINGSSSLVLNQNRSVAIFSDGVNYQVSVGGSGTLITPATIAEGGTGSATATAARTALAVPGLATANTFTTGLQQLGSASGVPVHASTAQTTAPALTSCGTGSPAITGTDTAGIVTLGTSATGCIITFNVAYTGTPYCVVSWIATPLASQSYVTASSTITLTQTSTSGNKIQYICLGTAGG